MQQLFNFPTAELQQEDTMYITITQQLHSVSLTDDKDRIQFDNLLNKAFKKLDNFSEQEAEKLKKQLDLVLQMRNEMVNHSGSLVIYITFDNIYYYHIGIDVTDGIFINDIPYILPLAEAFQFEQNYHLLALNRENARIFEGHGEFISELYMDDVDADAPINLKTALEKDNERGNLNFGTYDAGHGQAGTQQFFHGHGDVSQEKDADREHYFRIVDRFILDHYSSETEWPLVLFTVEENYAVFKNISKNNFLSNIKIEGSTAGLNDNEIRKKVSQRINHITRVQKEDLLNKLNEIPPTKRIDNISDDLAAASFQGQIDTLYVKKNLQISGTITEDGTYDQASEKNDFVLLLVNNVINTGGKVYVFDSEELPESLDITAQLRF